MQKQSAQSICNNPDIQCQEKRLEIGREISFLIRIHINIKDFESYGMHHAINQAHPTCLRLTTYSLTITHSNQSGMQDGLNAEKKDCLQKKKNTLGLWNWGKGSEL